MLDMMPPTNCDTAIACPTAILVQFCGLGNLGVAPNPDHDKYAYAHLPEGGWRPLKAKSGRRKDDL